MIYFVLYLRDVFSEPILYKINACILLLNQIQKRYTRSSGNINLSHINFIAINNIKNDKIINDILLNDYY